MHLKSFFIIGLLLTTTGILAQRESFEYGSYLPPSGWNREVKKGIGITYSTTDKASNSWCQVIVYIAHDSKGSVQADFESEWSHLVVKNYGVKDAPQVSTPASNNGWERKKGTGMFTFNNMRSTAVLQTFTGFGKSLSMVAISNSNDYAPMIDHFFDSVEMKRLMN